MERWCHTWFFKVGSKTTPSVFASTRKKDICFIGVLFFCLQFHSLKIYLLTKVIMPFQRKIPTNIATNNLKPSKGMKYCVCISNNWMNSTGKKYGNMCHLNVHIVFTLSVYFIFTVSFPTVWFWKHSFGQGSKHDCHLRRDHTSVEAVSKMS